MLMNGNDLNNYHAEVAVLLKDTVNDPQGITATRLLSSIGFEGIRSIRIGKMVQVDLVAKNEDEAYKLVTETR
jgi:phosphoribosylformylglycinamidine synthase PurS subunit